MHNNDANDFRTFPPSSSFEFYSLVEFLFANILFVKASRKIFFYLEEII